jgi:hypothetical protein
MRRALLHTDLDANLSLTGYRVLTLPLLPLSFAVAAVQPS